ncbi:CynX/NimT family MFS transporter [Arthrobacter castelli]|uniref:CynX/NimT family MFS transporter n=1 Tax=Arthrobacter castelli TaxID=271431 RepID=UPI00056100FA|nr:CynX/NimT family MFS transporter [Arthrobacter castelli]
MRQSGAKPTPGAGSSHLNTGRALVYLAVCIVLIGLNLRTLYSSFSAILPEITSATGMSAALVSALTTVPVLLLGVCAPAAPSLSRRFGAERVILAAMVVLTAGLAARGLGAAPALLAGTIACGAAIAVVNVLLPSLVKRDFQHRLGTMSGLYTGAICASAALGAGFTHPIYAATESWQFGLFSWTLPAAVVVLLFAPLALRRKPARISKAVGGPSVWRSHTAWQVTIFMVLQAMMSFSVFAWLAPILRERGVDGGTAGLMVAVSILLQVAGSFLAPAIAARCYDQRTINLVIALLTGGGFALSIFGPLELIWVWIAMLGLGQGSMTALALTMIVLRTRDAATASHLSGMMQGVGYGVGSSGTLLVGVLYEGTGTFTAAGVMFLVVGVLGAVFGYRAGRRRIVGEDMQS